MNARRLLIAVLIASASSSLMATERPDHFKGEAAETLPQAVSNFSEYNEKLSALVEKDELTAAELHQVHELTYTLENALGKIQSELAELAETLEEVHVASEQSDAETVKTKGSEYLETSRQIVE
ncbi:hypothetical protein HG264_12835 [Pseudomonas sp. gcc21]|uniref:DUF6746 family protein n=1 Tax=Pseudomonas sp. gcc21 TaxID=2726989 RepID=UPI0014517331|nr:DUF6746 family protein [Pseudomonas sp. gcc21]QJD59727.1 hypothetical protein HG264_12835 [Pseudomonas sp. gcc21]